MDQSNFYENGAPKWISKNPNNDKGNQQEQYDLTQDVISDLVCSDVSIDISDSSMFVSKGEKSFFILLEKITSMDMNSQFLTVNCIDSIPYYLVFKTVEDAISVENRVFNAYNNNIDPGC